MISNQLCNVYQFDRNAFKKLRENVAEEIASTKANASEFLSYFEENYADKIEDMKTLVRYYAERPGVEKLGSHGLFSQTDDKINLDEVADEVSNHNGVVWTHVLSLHREDAERLGYRKGVEKSCAQKCCSHCRST